MILLENATYMDPASGVQGQRDILLKGDRVFRITEPGMGRSILEQIEKADIGDEGPGADADTTMVIDCTGLIAAPGLIDVHVHFRDPGFTYKEDLQTGAKAAAAGGFTTVVLMANVNPAVDCPEVIQDILSRGNQYGIRVLTCANITKGMAGKELVDMKALQEAGAVGFTDDGKPLLSEALVRSAMEKAQETGLPLSFHEEDPAYITENGINDGVAKELGYTGSPRQAEITMVERDVRLALEYETDISIQHISSEEAVELVRRAKKKSPHVFAEVTPHHFTLTQEAVKKHGTLAKMNPPLREERDRLALIKGLQDGTIDMIATDHAPHTAEEKEKPLTQAPSGIIGLETALSLGIRELVHPGYLTMIELLRKMTKAPADLYHLDAGYLQENGPADLVLFSQEETRKVESFQSKSWNSPFLGEELPGVIHYTICKGQVVFGGDR